MLAIARAKVPGVRLWRARLEDFEVEEPVSAVVCPFSSIAYVRPIEDLRRSARRFFAALLPRGLAIVEPFIPLSAFRADHVGLHAVDAPDLKAVRVSRARGEAGRLAEYEFHWLVARPGEEVEHFVERHRLMLYERDELRASFEEAGFRVRFEEAGLMPERGLLVARRPA
jgi:hypothetical protein